MSENLRFIEHDSTAYRNMRVAIAVSYCPPIYPCADCGGPTITGYSCTRCGSVDPLHGEDSNE